ncbi:YSIRK-type signal peptide-containing protein, partial [uncultured Streptococcus sp.]|uniref:YSIRK-type signal peptide-containing protein n=1 Tax=uncultured Streptococcus sp. TaxID=83427 RepID=UPI0028D7F569
MFGKRHKDNGEKVFRYSIRKYHFGAASVAIAALIFFANGVAQAETLPVRPETANVQSSPEGELSDSGGRAVSEVQPAEQPKVLTQSVNKDALRIAIGNLSDVVRKVESSKLVALESQLTQVVEESKRLLEDGGATEQAVATEVETINSLIREVEKLLPKSEPTVDEPADKKDKEASIEHPKDEKKVVSDQEKSKKDLSIVDKAKLNEDKAAVNQGSEDRLTSNPNKVAKKELPTYSNENNGATNLSNELYFIYGELKKANTDTSKIQEVKDAYDRINNAIPLANNGVVNQAIFDAALVDLKKARDLIESVLNGKTTDDSTTTPVNPQPRSGGEELPSRGRGRTRTTRTVRVGAENYDNSVESFFEDGKKGNSPYDKYTYIFYSRRQVNTLDKANRRVDESRNQIYADVTPTNSGFKWDIYINRSKYDLSDAVGWFTIPSGQDVIPGTTVMSWSGADGNHASAPNDGTVSGALREAGFRNVTEGTPQNSGVNKAGNSTVNKKYTSSSLRSLTHNGGITGQNPYKKNLESPDEQKLAEDKFDIIERSNGKLFYFELNNNLKTYHLSFETRGSNNINNLAYAVGMKGERTDDDNPQLRARFLVNQWYARVPREVDDTDRFKFKVSGNGYFKIDQNTVNPIFAPGSNDYKQTRDGIIYRNHYDYANKPLDPNTNGVLTYNASGGLTDYRNIDFTSYGEYFNESGTIIPKEGGGKSGAASRGQNFQFIKDENGATRTLSREEVTLDAVRTPGVHTYRYNRSFNDGSHDTGKFSFVTKPKTPTLTTDLARQAGKTINIQADNGTNGYEMRLYKRAANGSLTEVLGANGKPLTATAGANGVATFTNVKVEEADYVVKTVVEGKWVDYDNTRHSTVESDESNIKTATDGVPPVVSVNGTPLPTSKNNANPVLYEVTQGGRFNPTIKVWDNSGKINSLSIANTPAGVNKEKFRQDFRNQTTATEATPYTAPTLEGTVANNQTPGIHIAEISTSDANGNSQTYYFNYKVKPTAPVVTGTTTGDKVLSTDRSLSGTATAGAKIKVIVADRTVADNITVGTDGRWTVTLPTGLNSNDTGQDQLVTKDPVRVIQTVNNVESSATTVTVAVGGAQVQPTVAGGTSVYAGAKTITVNAPHDSGMFYVRYREKDSNAEKEIGIKRDSITGPWTSIKPELGVVTGTTTRDGFVDSVTIEMKESIKEGSVSAVANIKQGLYSSPRGWQTTPVTDDAPTLTPSFQGDKKVVEAGSTLNLTDLVRASDKEDSPGLTRGNGTQVEVVSVNGNTGNKTINTNQVGRYTVRLKATDSQGKVSPEKDVTVEVKPTAPVVTGTTTGDKVL